MGYLTLLTWSLIITSVVSGALAPQTNSNPPLENPRQAPTLLSPKEGEVITQYPRTIAFQWGSVRGAVSYTIEVDCDGCCGKGGWCSDVRGKGHVVADLREPTYTFNFWGDQAGRWRVWATDRNLRDGLKSEWRGFSCKTEGKQTSEAADVVPMEVSRAEQSSPRETVYPLGKGVTPPRPIQTPHPSYTDKARKAKVNGTVVLHLVVGPDGLVKDVKVDRSLTPDLDKSAIETVKTWRFEPARKDGRPVAVEFPIEIAFYLH